MKKYIALITGLLPLFASAQLVMTGSYYVVLNGGSQSNPTSLVLTNSAPSGITNTGSGWIVSENEFNQVDWNVGTNTGTYVVPFGYGASDYLPVTCNVATAGVGNGNIKFATYHAANWDNSLYEPSDVTNMTDFGATNYSNNAVDRFWILDAQGYSTMPSPNITFTYIRSGAESEIADPNYIVEHTLIAQRFNASSSEWYDWFGSTNTDVTNTNAGTVTSGAVAVSGFYRSWCLFNDSTQLTSVPEVSNITSTINVFPVPTAGSFTVAGLIAGQRIELYDYLGQNLTNAIADNSTMQFDITTRANGIYLIRILNADNSLAMEKKIIKTK
jgi:hypothetical protein